MVSCALNISQDPFSAFCAEGSFLEDGCSGILVVTSVFGGDQHGNGFELFICNDSRILFRSQVKFAFEDSLYHELVPSCFSVVVVDSSVRHFVGYLAEGHTVEIGLEYLFNDFFGVCIYGNFSVSDHISVRQCSLFHLCVLSMVSLSTSPPMILNLISSLVSTTISSTRLSNSSSSNSVILSGPLSITETKRLISAMA